MSNDKQVRHYLNEETGMIESEYIIDYQVPSSKDEGKPSLTFQDIVDIYGKSIPSPNRKWFISEEILMDILCLDKNYFYFENDNPIPTSLLGIPIVIVKQKSIAAAFGNIGLYQVGCSNDSVDIRKSHEITPLGEYIYEDIRNEIMFCGEPDHDNHVLLIPEKRRQELYKASRAITPNSIMWQAPTKIYGYRVSFGDCDEIKLATVPAPPPPNQNSSTSKSIK